MTKHIRWIPCCLLLSSLLGGCQGTGETHNFNLHALPSSPARSEAFHDDSIKILVQPFRDNRDQTQRIGHRTHFWGGTTQFNAWDGNVGDGMADLAVEYLLQRKWQATKEHPTTDGSPPPPADVILTGDVLTLHANAKSGFGFTDIEVKMKVGFEAKNLFDGSTVRMVLGANGSDRVVTFDPKDVEKLTNLVAKDLFNQLFQDLTVKDKAFHLKSDAR
ncbi:MAG: hypothetical protein AB7P17_04175 [Nitrospirales bacterium]